MMKLEHLCLACASLFVSVAGCDGGQSSSTGTSTDAAPLALHGESDLLPGFSYSTGLQPSGSPVQASFDLSAHGNVAVDAKAAPSGSEAAPALNGVPGSGKVALSGGFAMTGKLKVDISGLPSYDGPIPGIEDVKIDFQADAAFDPFSIGKKVVAHAAIPPTELPKIPLPGGLPGSLVLDVADGSFIEIGFTGTCAAIDGKSVTYDGAVARGGALVIHPHVEIDVPLAGTKTFEIPSFTVDLALGTTDLPMKAEVGQFGAAASGDPAKVGKCEDGSATGGSGGSGGSGAAGGSGGSGAGGSGGSGAGGSGGSGAAGGSGGGPVCNDSGPEPNDTAKTATSIADMLDCTVPTITEEAGTLGGADHVDFFSFPNGIDVCAGPAKPKLQVLSSAGGTRFCLFPKCALPDVPQILECQGASDYTVADGVEGCCSVDADVVMHLECTAGSGTLTDFVVRVDQPGVDACSDYSYALTYTL